MSSRITYDRRKKCPTFLTGRLWLTPPVSSSVSATISLIQETTINVVSDSGGSRVREGEGHLGHDLLFFKTKFRVSKIDKFSVRPNPLFFLSTPLFFRNFGSAPVQRHVTRTLKT